MESRWFFLPGQTLENTQIRDRRRALHITAAEYDNIQGYMDRNRKTQEILEKEESRRKYLYEGSRNMTKNWPNSLENITKNKEAERLRKIETTEAERLQRFFDMREEQEEIRKKITNEVKAKLFRHTGISRDLTTAFRYSEVIYEREKQKEFKQFIKAHEDELEAQFGESVKEDAKQDAEERKEKERKLREREIEYKKQIKSVWFLFPGQTLENTRIEDRGHALHITADKYEHIKRHLDRNSAVQEMLEREESKRKYLAEGSWNMIKNWDNSLENITRRKEEERLRQIEANKTDKIQRFYNIRKEQEAVRKEYVEKIKKKMFRNAGISRDLTSAFRLSEILYEREKQKEFKQFIKEHEAEEDAEYAEYVKKNAQEELKEKKENAKMLYENKKQYGKYLKAVIEENAANEKRIRETTKAKEIEDNLRSLEEMELIKRKEAEKVLEKKREMKLALNKHINANRERQLILEEEEKEKDEVVEIYQEAKQRIECLKKDKVKELQDAILARREEVAKLAGAGEKERDAREERQFKNAVAERDAMDKIKRKKKEKHLEKSRMDRLKDRETAILREKEAQKRDTEIGKWEMLNRYRRDEISNIYEQKRKQEEWNKILAYRKVLLDQMEENEKVRLREQEIEAFNAAKCFDGEDAQFFDYADEVMELAKKTGRSTYPIEKVIMDYKKINCLKVPVCEQSNCEDYLAGKRNSRSRDIANTTKQRPCKCNNATNKNIKK